MNSNMPTTTTSATTSSLVQQPTDVPAADNQTEPIAIRRTQAESDWEFVAHVEVDRFCDQCGYNLYTAPVGKHPDLNLLLVRCPDCGHVHAARDQATSGSIWMKRLAVPLTIIWLAILLSIPFFAVMAQIGMNIGSVEEAREYVNREYTSADGSITTLRTRIIDPDYPESPQEKLFINMFRTLFFTLGLVTTTIATVVLPHWYKWAHIAVAVFLALLAPLFLCIFIHYEFATPWPEGLRFAYVYFGLFVGASIIAAFAGRILARAVVRLALPPRLRTPFTYLWTVDGKTPPPMKLATS